MDKEKIISFDEAFKIYNETTVGKLDKKIPEIRKKKRKYFITLFVMIVALVMLDISEWQKVSMALLVMGTGYMMWIIYNAKLDYFNYYGVKKDNMLLGSKSLLRARYHLFTETITESKYVLDSEYLEGELKLERLLNSSLTEDIKFHILYPIILLFAGAILSNIKSIGASIILFSLLWLFGFFFIFGWKTKNEKYREFEIFLKWHMKDIKNNPSSRKKHP